VLLSVSLMVAGNVASDKIVMKVPKVERYCVRLMAEEGIVGTLVVTHMWSGVEVHATWCLRWTVESRRRMECWKDGCVKPSDQLDLVVGFKALVVSVVSRSFYPFLDTPQQCTKKRKVSVLPR
jgi:hypothetical protein